MTNKSSQNFKQKIMLVVVVIVVLMTSTDNFVNKRRRNHNINYNSNDLRKLFLKTSLFRYNFPQKMVNRFFIFSHAWGIVQFSLSLFMFPYLFLPGSKRHCVSAIYFNYTFAECIRCRRVGTLLLHSTPLIVTLPT